MSTQSSIANDTKRLLPKAFASTFRSSSGTATLYAPILSVAKYNGTAATYVPQSGHTFEIRAVAREKVDDVATISILTLDDGTVSVVYEQAKQKTFDLVVNNANGLLTLYGKCSNGGTSLVTYVKHSNNLGYVYPASYQKFNVDIATLTSQVTMTTTGTPADHYVSQGVSYHGYHIQTNGVERWILRNTGDAETGSNAGTNFEINRRADDGSNLGTALSINRQSGIVQTGGYNTVNARTGTAAPTSNANFIGQMFIDTTNKVVYAAVSVGSGASDWKQISN